MTSSPTTNKPNSKAIASSHLAVNNPITATTTRSDLLKEMETKDFHEIIQHEINYFYEFMDFNLQHEFKEFANRNGKGRSSDFLLLALVIITVLLVPQSVIQLHFTVEGYYHTSSSSASSSSSSTDDGSNVHETHPSSSSSFNSASVIAICTCFIIVSCCFIGWMIYFQDKLFQFLMNNSNKNNRNVQNHPNTTQTLIPAAIRSKPRKPLLESDVDESEAIHSPSAASIDLEQQLQQLPQEQPSEMLSSTMNSLQQSSSIRSIFSFHSKVEPDCVLGPFATMANRTKPATTTTTKKTTTTDRGITGIISSVSSTINQFHQIVASYLQSNRSQIIDRMNSLFMLQLQLFFLLQFIRFVFNFNCFDSDSISQQVHGRLSFLDYIVVNILGNDTCYVHAHTSSYMMKAGFLNPYSLQIFILPFIVFKGLPQTSIKVIWWNYATAVITFLLCVCIDGAYRALPSGIVWMLLTFFAIRDFQVRNIIIFLSTRKVQETMVSKNKAMEENHANEMRSLIANVAHDLKTPLASFTTGLDLIQMTLNEYGSILTLPNCPVREMIDSIQHCLTDIRNTNNFMLMTINRCIDYTKVAKGIKLLPRPETIDLMETIQLPMNCMRNIQSKMKITLLPFNTKAICSHVITDKQWLQENLLCLLSNAVKYSSEGEVTIRLFAKNVDDLDETGHDETDIYCTNNENNEKLRGNLMHGSTNVLHFENEFTSQTKTSVIIEGPSIKTNEYSRLSINNSKPIIGAHHDSLVANTTQSNILRSHPTITPTMMRSLSQKSFKTINSDKDVLVVEVEDTGIGMTDEAMKILFSPFNQTQRLAGGTGLGLFSLAKRVQALHGKYGVKRRRDGRQGSLFWFAIPYRPDPYMAELCGTTEVPTNDTNVSTLVVNSGMQGRRFNDDKMNTSITKEVSVTPNILLYDESMRQTIKIKHDEDSELDDATVMTKKRRLSSNMMISHRTMSSATVNVTNDVECNVTIQKDLNTALESAANSDAPHRILVVDDSPAILKMASMMLKKLGHSIATAENGQIAVNMVAEAYKRNEEESFTVILMDLQMPVMDGLEAISRIRTLEATFLKDNKQNKRQQHHMHWIIACSANSDIETKDEAMIAGANMFVSKPYNFTDLCAAIAASRE